MPIISCPECGKKLKLNTSLPGKRIQCPGCSTKFVPDDGKDDRPARRDDRRDRDDGRVRTGAARERRPRDDDELDDPRRPRSRDDDEDDRDEPRGRRRREDEDADDYDDRPRRKKRKQGSSKALILWLSIGGGGLLVVGAVVLILLLVLGGTTHDSIMRDILALANEAAGVLDTVKDRDSAKAAAVKLGPLCERGKNLAERFRDLPQPRAEERRKLLDKYESDFMKVGKRLQRAEDEARRNSAGEPSFQEALRRMPMLNLGVIDHDLKR